MQAQTDGRLTVPGWGTAGYEGEFLPVSTYRKMVDALDTAECINISPDLIRARMIKDPYECALIRLAIRNRNLASPHPI